MDKHKRWPKGKKRKPYTRDKDHNAPRRPVNGYVRFMTDRRDTVAAQNPQLSFAEVTKILGNQWTSLPHEEKKKYLDDAENDKAEYIQRLKIYNQKKQTKDDETPGSSRISPTQGTGEIPIFTEAFLDHNKAKDAELRQLKKSNAEYAEQSAMLQRHIENLQTAVTRLDSETQAHIQSNIKLKNKLLSMKELIVKVFKDLPLPGAKISGSNMTPSIKNADAYMKQMQQILENPSEEEKDFVIAAQEIMLKKRKREFQINKQMRIIELCRHLKGNATRIDLLSNSDMKLTDSTLMTYA